MEDAPRHLRLSQRIIDLVRFEVRGGSSTQNLTRLEARLLGYLALHADRVVPKSELLSKVWGYHSRVRSRAVSNTANRLRPKIEVDPSNPQHLVALYGRGLILRGVELLDDPSEEEPIPCSAPQPAVRRAGPLVGRDREVEEVLELLKTQRLVTLAGFGGVGKTTLAETLTARLNGHFIGLRTSRNVTDLAFEIGRVLNIQLIEGDAVESVGGILRGLGSTVVVLDNVEQVEDDALQAVVKWLDAAPEIRFLLTSRRSHGLPGEKVYRLRGLALPDEATSLDEIRENHAVQLFLRRARAVGGERLDERNAHAIRDIVCELGGVPLALELVASQLALRSPKQVLERLPELWSRRGSSASSHHADLHDVVQSSWDLLGPSESLALSALSVFEGTFTVEAAEAVVEPFLDGASPPIDSVLERLVDCSLLERTYGDQVRLSLYPAVHSFAESKLEEWSQEQRLELETYHGEYFGQLGDLRFLEGLTSSGLARCRTELIADLENAQVATHRAVKRGDQEVAVSAALGCAAAWIEQGPQSALVELIPPVLELQSVSSRAVRLRALLVSAMRGLARTSEAWEWLGDIDVVTNPMDRARLLMERGELHSLAGRLDEAASDHEQALRMLQDEGDRLGAARAQTLLGSIRQVQGECDEALDLLEQSLRTRRAFGDARGRVITLRCMSSCEWALGNLGDAKRCLEEASALARQLQDISRLGPTLMNLALVMGELDELEESKILLLEVLKLLDRVGHPLHHAVTRVNLADLCYDLGEYDEAFEHLDVAFLTADPAAWPRVTAYANALTARIWLVRGRAKRALRLVRRANEIISKLDDPYISAQVQATQAEVLGHLGEREEALKVLEAAEREAQQVLEGAVLGRQFVRFGHVLLALGDTEGATAFASRVRPIVQRAREDGARLGRELEGLVQAIEAA